MLSLLPAYYIYSLSQLSQQGSLGQRAGHRLQCPNFPSKTYLPCFVNVVKLLDPEYGSLLGKNLSIIHLHQIEIKMFNLLLALVLFNFVKCQQITGENEAKLAADLEIEAEMEGFFSSLDFQVLPSCHICLYAEIFTAFGAVTKFDALFLNVKVNSNNATIKIDDVLTEHGGLLHVLSLLSTWFFWSHPLATFFFKTKT